MARAILGLEQATALVGRMKAVAEGRERFCDLVMPNGQKLADCTVSYVAEIGEAMEVMGYRMPEPSGLGNVTPRRRHRGHVDDFRLT
jgi:hypothetical protein